MHTNYTRNLYIDSDGACDYFGSQNTYLIRDKGSDTIVGGAIGNGALTEKMKQLMFPTKGGIANTLKAQHPFDIAA